MRIKNWTFNYVLGYLIVSIGRSTFYKRYKIVGKENIPTDKPIMFCSNHQNAFMDPVLIAVCLSKPTSYLVRADVFKKKIVANIFYSINMQPIYRERDGVNTLEANKKTFNYCYDTLAKNRPIIIFPEGNHGKFKTLRPLKKGFARIAKGAEEKHGEDIDVQIVPVGINYSNHFNMGAEMLLNFGEPVSIGKYVNDVNNAAEINAATKALKPMMSELIIDIQNTAGYFYIHEMMMVFDPEIRTHFVEGSNDLTDKFKAQKSFISKAEAQDFDWEKKSVEMEQFSKDTKTLGLRYWLFKKDKHTAIFDVLVLLLLLPLHLYGMLNNYIPYKIPANFVKKIKDIQFHSSLKMAMGVILFGVFWGLQILLVALLTDGIAFYYTISLPISAYISYHYWIHFLKTRGKIQYNKLSKKNAPEFKKLMEKYHQYQKELSQIIGS